MRLTSRAAVVGVPVAAAATVLALLGAGHGAAPQALPPTPTLTAAADPVSVAVAEPAMPHPGQLTRAGQPARASRDEARPTVPPTPTASHRHAAARATTRSLARPAATSSSRVASPTHRATSTPAPRPTHTATSSPTATPTPRKTATSTSGRDAFVARVLQLVNAQRASHGLRPFTLSSCAGRFAQPWADHLATAGALSHQSLTTVLTSCGAHTAGENVGYTTLGADDLVARWMASAPHRANILNPAFTSIGLGATRADGRWYGVQDFLG
ncbi:MAG TPA: CAP domain-containing protein [Motilibacteraceae bacterium]|nr:CAP domain-containing protein [Motilibacteraceae bacterium]